MPISKIDRSTRRVNGLSRWYALAPILGCLAVLAVLAGAVSANSFQPPVTLGTASTFAVLAGTTVTNTGNSVLNGDLGVYPGAAITGFPPGVVTPPANTHAADGVAANAESALTTAYGQAAAQTSTATVSTIGGNTLSPGVYTSGSSLGLTGAVTLDGGGDPNAVFIFQMNSTLTTASNSTVVLTNGAQACNVFWQVGSSATLGTGTTFVGAILASASVTLTTGASVLGEVLAQSGAVTLDDNTITVPPTCNTAIPTTTSSPTATSTATSTTSSTPTPTSTITASPTATSSSTPTPVIGASDSHTPLPTAGAGIGVLVGALVGLIGIFLLGTGISKLIRSR